MFDNQDEKDKITVKLSEQYSNNIISMEEYERLLDYINKTETRKELMIIEKIIEENGRKEIEYAKPPEREVSKNQKNEEILSLFSWRTSHVTPVIKKGGLAGSYAGGKFISIFGTNKIIVDKLPPGQTKIKVESIFGLTEIMVSKNIRIKNKIEPIFSGVFAPNDNIDNEALPELIITGTAVFGNVTINRINQYGKD